MTEVPEEIPSIILENLPTTCTEAQAVAVKLKGSQLGLPQWNQTAQMQSQHGLFLTENMRTRLLVFRRLVDSFVETQFVETFVETQCSIHFCMSHMCSSSSVSSKQVLSVSAYHF